MVVVKTSAVLPVSAQAYWNLRLSPEWFGIECEFMKNKSKEILEKKVDDQNRVIFMKSSTKPDLTDVPQWILAYGPEGGIEFVDTVHFDPQKLTIKLSSQPSIFADSCDISSVTTVVPKGKDSCEQRVEAKVVVNAWGAGGIIEGLVSKGIKANYCKLALMVAKFVELYPDHETLQDPSKPKKPIPIVEPAAPAAAPSSGSPATVKVIPASSDLIHTLQEPLSKEKMIENEVLSHTTVSCETHLSHKPNTSTSNVSLNNSNNNNDSISNNTNKNSHNNNNDGNKNENNENKKLSSDNDPLRLSRYTTAKTEDMSQDDDACSKERHLIRKPSNDFSEDEFHDAHSDVERPLDDNDDDDRDIVVDVVKVTEKVEHSHNAFLGSLDSALGTLSPPLTPGSASTASLPIENEADDEENNNTSNDIEDSICSNSSISNTTKQRAPLSIYTTSDSCGNLISLEKAIANVVKEHRSAFEKVMTYSMCSNIEVWMTLLNWPHYEEVRMKDLYTASL